MRQSQPFFKNVNTSFNDETDTFRQTAYALDSLNGANGLNPMTMQFFPSFGDIQKLMVFATKEVRKDSQWKAIMSSKYFNFCSVKLYHTYEDSNGKKINKDTNWLADSLYKKNRDARSDNFQVLDTPAAIFTFGDQKISGFESITMRKNVKQIHLSTFNKRVVA
eukprot:15341089-Ditylum_brightwellii.AAC.1